MPVMRNILFPVIALFFSACAVINAAAPQKIVLLGPFQGRYREIGYDALYAALLAIADSGTEDITLLPLHEGIQPEIIVRRAQAIRKDPDVAMVLLVGPHSVSPSVQETLDGLPIMIIGHWGTKPATDSTYILANREIEQIVTTSGDLNILEAAQVPVPLIGHEIFALEQFPLLRDSLDGITIVSSGSLPNPAFRERYMNSAEFAPAPGLLATLAYDATALAIQAITQEIPLDEIRYKGLNGKIAFQDGYWADAPINRFGYNASRQLIPQ